ncbi:MAG: hypothetical protein WCX95_03345, partial [Candidatus Gracilibacteria bacterium]
APWNLMTSQFTKLKAAGGEVGAWAERNLAKGKELVAKVKTVGEAKVGAGTLAGPMIEGVSGVRPVVPPYGGGFITPAYAEGVPDLSPMVERREELAPSEEDSAPAVVLGAPAMAPTPAELDLSAKAAELTSTFKDKGGEKYKGGDWHNINKSVATLMGITQYDEENFRETVKDIQTQLKSDPKGRPLKPDGKIGPITMAAIEAWNKGKDIDGNQYHGIALKVNLSSVTARAVARLVGGQDGGGARST